MRPNTEHSRSATASSMTNTAATLMLDQCALVMVHGVFVSPIQQGGASPTQRLSNMDSWTYPGHTLASEQNQRNTGTWVSRYGMPMQLPSRPAMPAAHAKDVHVPSRPAMPAAHAKDVHVHQEDEKYAPCNQPPLPKQVHKGKGSSRSKARLPRQKGPKNSSSSSSSDRPFGSHYAESDQTCIKPCIAQKQSYAQMVARAIWSHEGHYASVCIRFLLPPPPPASQPVYLRV